MPNPRILQAIRIAAAFAGLLAISAPARADLHYTTQMQWNGGAIFEAPGSAAPTAGSEIKRSVDPSFPEGAVIFTREGGNIAYLYSTQSSECIKMSSDQLVDFKRTQIRKMHITADDLKVERIADEDAPAMFDLKVHHTRLRISATMHVPAGPSTQDYVIAVEEDMWTAPDIHDQAPNLAVYTNSTTGIPLLDDGITAELAKIQEGSR